MPAVSIVNCTGACTSTVRENAQGGPAAVELAGRRDRDGRAPPTDAGYTLTFGGAFQGTDVDPFSVTNATAASPAPSTETTKGGAGMLPVGATATVAAFGGAARSTTPASR